MDTSRVDAAREPENRGNTRNRRHTQAVKPPEFAEDVLREVRERPGRNDNHRDELMVQERRMLDEHFFLYNDVPDTGMGQRRTSTCASIRGLREVLLSR